MSIWEGLDAENLKMLLLIIAGLIAAAGVFAALFFIRAPYGRYYRKGWGPTLSSRVSWLLMESPSVVVMAACFVTGTAPKNLTVVVFLGDVASALHSSGIHLPFSDLKLAQAMASCCYFDGFRIQPCKFFFQWLLSVFNLGRLPGCVALRSTLPGWPGFVYSRLYYQPLGRPGSPKSALAW